MHAELSTLTDATKQLERIKTRIGDCRDEDEARQLLSEMRDAEEAVVIKQIRGKRIAADLESVIADAETARQAAQSEAAAYLRHAPQEVAGAITDMIETCRHESRKPRDPRSLDDVIHTLVPMAVAHRLEEHLRTSIRLYCQETDPTSRKLEVLQQSVSSLLRLHDGRDELAAETARIAAACAAFRKAYAKR
ncbi:MAG: hypothetical protein EOP21_07300 [Hyphomicrobiales bacterium]|nr:MAG: hypothetical protein EOP21_07300 [Hyphomicrobiales bacterium]